MPNTSKNQTISHYDSTLETLAKLMSHRSLAMTLFYARTAAQQGSKDDAPPPTPEEHMLLKLEYLRNLRLQSGLA
jgi:hypothetical protein